MHISFPLSFDEYSEAVTDGHINAAARSLAQTRTDLAARQAEIEALKSASHDDQKSSFFSIFSSSPNAASKLTTHLI